MKATIEIDGVPEGYEAVAFREPARGDSFVTQGGSIGIYVTNIIGPRLIVRKVWTWPEWLKCDELRYHSGQTWHGYSGGVCAMVIDFLYIDHPEPPDRNRVYKRADYVTDKS